MTPIMTDKMYENLFQIGTTLEMLGVKEMSVKELYLTDGPITLKVSMAANITGAVIMRVDAPHSTTILALEHSQAYLLKLWLEEHLK